MSLTCRQLIAALGVFCLLPMSPVAQAAGDSFTFGINPHRSVVVTAQYWNPILTYVSRKSGIKLEMRMEKTGQEYSAKVGLGEYDFAYTNHIFNPANAKIGYRVFARPDEDMIRGEIVVLKESPAQKLEDLKGLEVGFPSKAAFVGYAVTLDALTRRGVAVKQVFGGTQEGIMTQLKAGKVAAAGVNSQIMRDFAQRENVMYRVLWQSQEFLNLPLVAHPRVPAKTVAAVRKAMVEMVMDPEGKRILEASAALIGQKPPFGFEPATDREYRNQWEFYRTTVVPEFRK
jgi:ABC-type phosphate/phosphonate transport system substrate-binding protein